MPAGDGRGLGDPLFSRPAQEPVPVPADSGRAAICKVDGVDVAALYVTVSPAAVFVSQEGGTHEFTRLYFFNGHFQLGSGNDKLGPAKIVAVEYARDTGMTMRTHDGRSQFVPVGRTYATWTVSPDDPY